MNYELWIAQGFVVILAIAWKGRISLGTIFGALVCVFIGWVAGALHVLHVLMQP